MTDYTTTPNRDGADLIKDWLHAQERLRRAKSEVNSAECDVNNSMRALAKWMLPTDARAGEKFCVWFGDSLIQVEVMTEHNADPEVTIRTRGKSISLAA